MAETENKNIASPLNEEGLRGDGTARWYVVHTYSGYENKVKMNIEKMVENRGMEDRIQEIVVPTEDRLEIRGGQRKIVTRKLFPGYVIIKMIIDNETWYLVRNAEGVTGFVGHGTNPAPLTDEEVTRMGIEKMVIELDVKEGDSVRIISGPFEGFIGEVQKIDKTNQVLTVSVPAFGRDTPVEIEFGQVDKMS